VLVLVLVPMHVPLQVLLLLAAASAGLLPLQGGAADTDADVDAALLLS
jgi:hypothetical protein